MRRVLYWLGMLAAVVAIAAGAVVAVRGYEASGGPAGAVRGYFAALAAADAPTALAYGDVPAGPRDLLTSTVLREQQRIAPLRQLTVLAMQQHGSRAVVQVRYLLAFAQRSVPITVKVGVHDAGGTWRLDRVAVPVRLYAVAARQRETILGAPVPRDQTLLFPGALPITLDTPYLALDPEFDSVSFAAPSTLDVRIDVTSPARAAIERATLAAVRVCVTGHADPACPLPDERYVPGSVHGVLDGGLRAASTVLDPSNTVGLITVTSRVAVRAAYRRLTFHNVQVAGHGTVQLRVSSAAYAVPPLRLRWTPS